MKKLVCHCQSVEADINIAKIEKVIRCNKYKLTDKDWQEQENQWLIQRFLAHNDCNVSIRIKYERHHHPFKDYTSRNGNVTISGDVYLPLKH